MEELVTLAGLVGGSLSDGRLAGLALFIKTPPATASCCVLCHLLAPSLHDNIHPCNLLRTSVSTHPFSRRYTFFKALQYLCDLRCCPFSFYHASRTIAEERQLREARSNATALLNQPLRNLSATYSICPHPCLKRPFPDVIVSDRHHLLQPYYFPRQARSPLLPICSSPLKQHHPHAMSLCRAAFSGSRL